MSVDDSTAVLNVLHRYAELVDLGDLEGAAGLFSQARLKVRGGNLITGEELLELWRRQIILYEDGTPRTKHLITNPIVEIDESASTATCRSYYTVLQGTAGTLGVVVAGRYHDTFAHTEGSWHFTFRDYSLVDHWGDTSGHLRNVATP